MRKLLFFISVFCSMAVQLSAQNPGVMEQANLIIFPPQMERVVMKQRDGRPRERIRADALRALIGD